ncbi:MAG: hypothetical protein PQJ46_14255, partial [Spirochaetales bacterium]|nr:hypothetical protein [Spirochaetales bacterium]
MIATNNSDRVSVNGVFPSTIVSDAFEAVTNGMSNPGTLEKLELLQQDPETEDWYKIIKAIKAFYAQDFEEMQNFLSSIEEDSIEGSLKNVLYYMSGIRKTEIELTRQEEKLAAKVTENSRFLSGALTEL